MPEPRHQEIRIDSWEAFVDEVAGPDYQSWAFRGQANASWKLYSSLSRYLLDYCVRPEAWPQQELRILRIFRRKAHHFLPAPPEQEDAFEWLALMQHHGAPTRLLDFTWSPYVAAFFALERASVHEEDKVDAAVWAVHPPSADNRKLRTIRASQLDPVDDIGPWTPGNYERYFVPNEQQVAIYGEPPRMNRRLIAQSGTFVMPGVLDRPVEELIPAATTKFVLDAAAFRRRALTELYNMNISHATLFPDLDGLARSLAWELEFHWAFDPTTMETREDFFTG